MKDKDKITQ